MKEVIVGLPVVVVWAVFALYAYRGKSLVEIGFGAFIVTYLCYIVLFDEKEKE